jgi:hypothetical protein
MTACVRDQQNNYGLGKYDTYQCTEFETTHRRVIFKVSEGDELENIPRSATITAICNSEEEAKITDAHEDTDDPSKFIIRLDTKLACPSYVPIIPSPVFDATSCTFTAADQYFVDLSAIMGVSMSYTDPLFKNTITVNTCSLCGNAGENVCLTTYDGSEFSGGALASMTAEEYATFRTEGLTLTVSNGDICPDGSDKKRKTIINYICDATATEPKIVNVDQGNCTYFVTVQTKEACIQAPTA